MPARLTRSGDALELDLSGCRGVEFSDTKDKIKDIPGRRFSVTKNDDGTERKVWVLPYSVPTAEHIMHTIKPEAEQAILDAIIEDKTAYEESLTSPIPDDADDLLIPWAYKRCAWQPAEVNDEAFTGLLPYQRAAVSILAGRTRGILADDMGLGKTLQAISVVEEYRERNGQMDGPKLVIAPASVKGSWARELQRWLGPETPVVVVEGSYSKTKTQSADERRAEVIQKGLDENAWIIVNWEQLQVKSTRVKKKTGGSKTVKTMKEPLFETTDWLAVIADEVHRAKNPKAQRTLGLWRCVGKVMLGLTGTPIMNSPDELWSILRWLYPEEFHELGLRKNAIAYWTFYFEYVDYYEDHFARKVITGVKNPDALRFILQDKLVRRTAEILGLKGRKRIRYPVELTPHQQRLYDEAETAMWLAVEKDIAAGNKEAIAFAREMAEKGENANIFQITNGAARLVRLQQIIENAALLGGDDSSANMDDFQQKFEDSKPNQWVVFCKFRESCDILAERLRKRFDVNVAVYNGDVHPGDRTKIEDAFQRGDIDVIVGTIGAMKEGITLTSAHLQYWLSESHVPAENEQGEARCDRLGQQSLVLVYRPMAAATVAAGSVRDANKLKERIVSTVIPKDTIKEELT